MHRYLGVIGVLLAGGLMDPVRVNGQGPTPRPVVRYADRTDTSPALRDLPQRPPTPAVLGQIFERPRKLLPNREGSIAPAGPVDTAVQTGGLGLTAPTTTQNFEGVPNVNGVLPPDTVGDIGPNHYVQMVNLAYAVFDRNGTKLYGPVNANALWSNFGGACETTNDGDPVALYDHLADRWMLSQFALPNYPSGPFYQCIAVSQTGDPLGAYYRYAFLISNTKLNDYPKFGVWPDGYYMSMNQYSCNFFGCSWGGQGVVTFEREKMLLGQQARMVYFDLFAADRNLGGMLPADLDGAAPPSGTPNYFALIDDDSWGYSPDQMQIWAFTANWNNPNASTFARHTTLPVAGFDANMCNYSRNCIPQEGTGRKLDAISDRLMFRLQYRNFGTYQAMVTNHTVDVDGSNRAGVRWYELRSSGGAWSIHQQGTFSPDSNHRWMGSAAMNGTGDIALGYSISSTAMKPSIRAAGRVAADPSGTLPQGEVTIMNGGGSQSHNSSRWGDYSAMSVDPIDDCTFWYTTEYHDVDSLAAWNTRIASFRIGSCGPVDNPPTVDLTSPATGSTVAGTVTMSATATPAAGDSITNVVFKVNGAVLCTVTTTPYTCGWNTASGSYPDGSYSISATATDNDGQSSTDTNTVTVDNVPDPPPGESHIGALTGSSQSQGKNKWRASVAILVQDSTNNAVSNATVSGAWSTGNASQCTTDSSGTCSVDKAAINNNVSSVMFSVTGVTHATLTYNSSTNVVSSVAVAKP